YNALSTSQIYTLSLHDALPILAEVLLRARDVLLTMVARLHQKKTETPHSLAELKALFDYDVAEVETLDSLAQQRDSWWNHLVQLDRKSTRLNSSHVKISYAVFC